MADVMPYYINSLRRYGIGYTKVNSPLVMRREAKAHWLDFRDEIDELLCKSQKNDFKKFQRQEKKKIKKLAKYCMVYKFPCGCNSK